MLKPSFSQDNQISDGHHKSSENATLKIPPRMRAASDKCLQVRPVHARPGLWNIQWINLPQTAPPTAPIQKEPG